LEPKGISFNDNVDTKNWGKKEKITGFVKQEKIQKNA
jgi:hypothetical protein